MSEAKHTPGPWEYGVIPEQYQTYCFGARGLLFGRVVGSPARDAEADARLIASAPDLLAACKMAVAAVLYAQTVDQSGSFDATRAALSAAIAKAEGGT